MLGLYPNSNCYTLDMDTLARLSNHSIPKGEIFMIPILKSYRQWQILFCLVLIIGLVIPFRAAGAVAGQSDANNVATPATIDGNLNEAGWSIVTPVSETVSGSPNNTVTFGTMWNST